MYLISEFNFADFDANKRALRDIRRGDIGMRNGRPTLGVKRDRKGKRIMKGLGAVGAASLAGAALLRLRR